MREVSTLAAPFGGSARPSRLRALARWCAATRAELALAFASALLLALSFPDFELWPLAWVALAPLALAVLSRRRGAPAFVLGWAAGAVFFYASCYWLTHAMIHYGGIPRPVAFALLVPAPLVVGLFPALWCLVLARVASRRGVGVALAVAPFAWAATEWARLGVTGQLWNALGYSQAYVPALIQPARWGGVYAVGFLIAAANSGLVYLLVKRDARAAVVTAFVLYGVALAVFLSSPREAGVAGGPGGDVIVVGVQPNVPIKAGRPAAETEALVSRHLVLSSEALRAWEATRAGVSTEASLPRAFVWPESPMNFTYAGDVRFRRTVSDFARGERASVLFNSLEPAPAGGFYNSAVLVDASGRLAAQYDKIRLLPFGEYVPLPRWLPASWMLAGMVGDFTPGDKYPLMDLGGGVRAGVFICFESAFPEIARTFARGGADVLVNISNDGYLGRTAVMRQHLANGVLRAVETGRPVLRVTNTGISARVTARGEVFDATAGFEEATRAWPVARAANGATFYARRGDLFAAACSILTGLSLLATFRRGKRYD